MGNLEAISTAKVAPDYLNLFEWMTSPTPLDRPTAGQALQRINAINAQVPILELNGVELL